MNKLCTFLFLTVLIGRDLNQSLQIAGDNSLEIKKAMSSVPLNQSKGMQWLITHMPNEDLKKVKAEFLLLNSTSNFEIYLLSINFSSTIENDSIKL